MDGGRLRYRKDTGLEALGIVALAFVLALLSPGAVATFLFAKAAGVALDLGQRWTFAVASSLVVVVALCAMSGARGFLRYLTISMAVSFVLLVARFGFQAAWAVALFEYYRP
ncbi:MAG: hypothetical protein HYZ29_08535 [Myxococcales bacterium]|nr:hypothetical protein [Myxococcales bacterium]